MKRTLGISLLLVAALLFVPLQASACKSCDVPSFWDPNCNHSGCTYCAACSICCGGDPDAGGNCALYCGGALSSTDASVGDFLASLSSPSASPDTPAFLAPASCSSVEE